MKNFKPLLNGLLCICFLTLTACNEKNCEHQYNWYVSKAVTCTTNGIMEGICQKCGLKTFEELLSVGHLYENGVCGECGKTQADNIEDGMGGKPVEGQSELNALTLTDFYETAKTFGFSLSYEAYKNYLIDLRIEGVYINALDMLRADTKGRFDGSYEFSVTIPITRVDYKMINGNTDIISSIDLSNGGSLYLTMRDGTYQAYGYVDEYIDKTLPINTMKNTIIGLAVNKENALLFKLKDGSVYQAGILLQDSTDLSEDTLLFTRVGNAYHVAGAMRKDIKHVVIPSTHRGLPVTAIKKSAFKDQYPLLESVSFENSQITTIGDFAFKNCTALTTVTLPTDRTLSVGYNAFQNTPLESLFK